MIALQDPSMEHNGAEQSLVSRINSDDLTTEQRGSKVPLFPNEDEEDKRMCLPTTPRKTQKRLLDYSTPRSRYCGQSQLPPTPDQTPSKVGKRSAVEAFEDLPVYVHQTKRRHTYPETPTTKNLFRRESFPNWPILYKSAKPAQQVFSADELKRTCEAVLKQVDWEEVQEYVASNRHITAYRKQIKSILQSEVSKLFGEEESDHSTE